MVENSAKDHNELFYYDDPQPTSESLNETPFDSSRFELVQSPDPATNFETNNSNFDHFFDQLKFGLSEKHTKFEKIFLMVLTNQLIYLVNVKTMRNIFQIMCVS